MTTIPELKTDVLVAIDAIKALPEVQQGLQLCLDEEPFAMQEQCTICEIPAPTFKEEVRGKYLAALMKAYGLEDVHLDEIGNCVGLLRGTDKGPVIAVGAHMDTVFPEGTPIKVVQEGNIYRAPGIGDNCSGVRALLQTIRCFTKTGVRPKGDIYFVATVGEEGNGDIRGSKWFNSHNHVDGFIACDNTDVGRILWAAIGSHRWRLSIDGKGGHSYAAFGQTPSAIHAMCRAGARIANIRPVDNPKTTYTIGTIKGGTSVNTIAPHCEVDVDIRSLDNDELLKLEAKILGIFEEAVAEENAMWPVDDDKKFLTLTKTQIGDRPAGQRPHDCPVLQASRAAQKVLGIELTNYGASSTDANYPVSLGIPATCLSAGGVQKSCHTTDEYFIRQDIHLGPQMIFLTLLGLSGYKSVEPILPKRAS